MAEFTTDKFKRGFQRNLKEFQLEIYIYIRKNFFNLLNVKLVSYFYKELEGYTLTNKLYIDFSVE